METTKELVRSILDEMDCKFLVFETPLKEQMDSVDQAALVIMLEDEFNISITDEDCLECNTMNDYVGLIESKVILRRSIEDPYDPIPTSDMDFYKPPSIDDQIKFIQDFVVDPEMSKAIRENLIAIRRQQQVRQAANMHLSTSTMSGHSFTEGMNDNPYEQK